jgi:hypothetical protein
VQSKNFLCVKGHGHIYAYIKTSAHRVRTRREKTSRKFVRIEAYNAGSERERDGKKRKIWPIKNNICINYNVTIYRLQSFTHT